MANKAVIDLGKLTDLSREKIRFRKTIDLDYSDAKLAFDFTLLPKNYKNDIIQYFIYDYDKQGYSLEKNLDFFGYDVDIADGGKSIKVIRNNKSYTDFVNVFSTLRDALYTNWVTGRLESEKNVKNAAEIALFIEKYAKFHRGTPEQCEIACPYLDSTLPIEERLDLAKSKANAIIDCIRDSYELERLNSNHKIVDNSYGEEITWGSGRSYNTAIKPCDLERLVTAYNSLVIRGKISLENSDVEKTKRLKKDRMMSDFYADIYDKLNVKGVKGETVEIQEI